ncbi:attachment protein [Stenotrophomonas sp. RIT309]|uniref:attachment protein n=1 Tax=Stenotrophomonas sp. RIT309 TaxID=1470590 RepID=UPI0012687A8F|nr:attachment protein [Stenotrophomonas sp. RIT309]
MTYELRYCEDQGMAFSAASTVAAQIAVGGFSGYGPGEVSTGAVELNGLIVGAQLLGPNGAVIGIVRRAFPEGKQCSTRPEQTTWRGPGPGGVGSVCHDGCAYGGSVYAGSPIGILFVPTGGTCSTNDHPSPTTPDPGEGGGDGGGTDPGDGGGDGGGDGDGGGGGGGDGGGDGGGPGPGDGDGDGDCTDPNGCTGTGPGPGTGEGEGGDGDGGAPGPTTGRLYKKSGKTVQKVLAEFKTAIEGAPILSKVKGFFGSCTGGGSCPTATWDGGQYAGKFDLGALCSGPLLQLFQYAGFVFLAGMGIVALRWALL